MGKRMAFRCKNIYTADSTELIDGYVMIEGNKFIVIGSEEDAKKYFDDDTIFLNYENYFIMPGLHDFHIHLIIGAMMEHDGILRYADSEEEAAQILWEKNKDNRDGGWILGGAWDHFRWPGAKLPNKKTLDKYVAERPVLSLNKECHGAWVNSKALEFFHITKDTPDPPSGGYERSEDGELTGYVHESAMTFMLAKIIEEMNEDSLIDFAKSFMKKANSLGITSVADLPIYNIISEKIYDKLDKKEELTVRIHFCIGMMEDIKKIKRMKKEYCGDTLRFIGVKDFLDGTPMGHSGYMLEPYSDMPDFRSAPVIEPDLLLKRVTELDQDGIKIRLHSCGDAAVRLGLDAFETAALVNGSTGRRHCIEHIESTTPEDIKRFGKLGVIASVQPEHMPKYDFYHHPFFTMIGEERMKYSWPFKSIQEAGGELAYGTDYPVAELSPFRGIYRSINRLTNEGSPEGGWNPDEKVGIHETLRAYTYGSAYAAERESEIGTLEAGKLADMIILDRNLFECAYDREKIFETQVLMTIMDGKVVYENERKDINHDHQL